MSAYSVIFGKRFLPNSRPPTFPHGPERLGPLERPGGGGRGSVREIRQKKSAAGSFPAALLARIAAVVALLATPLEPGSNDPA